MNSTGGKRANRCLTISCLAAAESTKPSSSPQRKQGRSCLRRGLLCIPRPQKLRLEERRQQTVHLQQAFAGQLNCAIRDAQLPRLGETLKTFVKFMANVRAELVLEVAGFQLAGFQL